MSRFTSALVFASPRGSGAFYSEDWRVGWCANLVEGSSAGPYWLPLPSEPDFRDVKSMAIESLDAELVADSLVLLLGTVFGSVNLLGLLMESHNVTQDSEGNSIIAPYWDLATDVRNSCLDDLRERIKLGVAVLDDNTLLSCEVERYLVGYGIQVSRFA